MKTAVAAPDPSNIIDLILQLSEDELIRLKRILEDLFGLNQ